MSWSISMVGSLFLIATIGFLSRVHAEEVLLEDYEGGGLFSPADWANTFSDGSGKQNSAKAEGGCAVVDWATQWSGLPAMGSTQDFSKMKTFQADVMVEKGQPNEEGANFYFQLGNETSSGYSYWETFVPQAKVPADGQWYRVRLPMSMMDKGHGDGGEPPTDFATIIHTTCGMTFDEKDNDKFKFKQARFDNVTLTDEAIESVTVELRGEAADE